MPFKRLYERFVTNLSDPDMRADACWALMGGKVIGLVLVLTAMRIFLRAGAVTRRRRPAARLRKSTRSTPRGR